MGRAIKCQNLCVKLLSGHTVEMKGSFLKEPFSLTQWGELLKYLRGTDISRLEEPQGFPEGSVVL